MTWQKESQKGTPIWKEYSTSGLLSECTHRSSDSTCSLPWHQTNKTFYQTSRPFLQARQLRLTDSHTQEGRYCSLGSGRYTVDDGTENPAATTNAERSMKITPSYLFVAFLLSNDDGVRSMLACMNEESGFCQ